MDIFLKNLPVNLSAKQKVAVENALTSKISYIQGPPGTGKSHTISAILLLGILMNKKILIVSQKTAALEVVKNKIMPFFKSTLPISFIHFTKETKGDLKNSLKQIKNLNDSLSIKSIDLLKQKITKTNDELKQNILQKQLYETELDSILNQYSAFFESNLNVNKKKDNLINNPVYLTFADFDNLVLSSTNNSLFLSEIKKIQIKFNRSKELTLFEYNKLLKLQHTFNSFYSLNLNFIQLINQSICYDFLNDWFDVTYSIKNNDIIQNKLTNENHLSNLRHKIQNLNSDIEQLKLQLFSLNHEYQLCSNLKKNDNISHLDQFIKLLRFEQDKRVLEKMNHIDYDKILEIFPVFLSEIRNIGEILPNDMEMFDLVLVDESSQVNLAEILPIFYRTQNICIVGDHLQLGLNSVGLTFSLNKKFDKLIWEKYKPNNLDYAEAGNRNLTITKSSILDLLQSEDNQHSFKTIMLDEHFRSLPGLSSYNNKNYYNNELKIMTEVPDKALVSCFSAIKVNGVKDDKVNEAEALETINVIKFLTCPQKNSDENNQRLNKAINLNTLIPGEPTIGIISLIRDQSNYIQDLIDEFDDEIIKKHRLVCGTPEQLQGDEFDIVIFTGVVDDNTRNHGHYNDSRRLNVAFSRSKFYTIFIYSSSKNIPSYFNYLKHFGIFDDTSSLNSSNVLGWSYDINKCESEFERNVSYQLQQIISEINLELNLSNNILMYNQVQACGMKRLDFVLYNPENNNSVVIEVDGIYHFENYTRKYSEEHKERIDILTRAGWKIINTPYFLWYKFGSLSTESFQFKKEIERIKSQIIYFLKSSDK